MFRRSTAGTSLVLTVVAGLTIFADDQGKTFVDVSRDGVRSNNETRPSPKSGDATPKVRRARVLFITKAGCDRCEQELQRLRTPGSDFDKLRAAGWKIGEDSGSHIQIVDRDSIPELMDLLKVEEFPTVAFVDDGEIVRSFKDGCTTPLDVWTFGWLLKGVSERPAGMISEAARVETTGNYRLRGNHWTVEGDPNPSKEAVLNHLRGPNHVRSVAAYGAIENWSYEEMRSLHDDIHEREGGGVAAVSYGYARPQAANQNLDAFSGSRKATGR
jgi:hypothetical protein